MGYLEYQVYKLEKRVQKIKATPDPSKPISNLLLFEAELEKNKALIKAREEGRPFALVSDSESPIVKALGFMHYAPSHAADRVGRENLPEYMDEVNELGIPDCFCDRMILCVPLILKEGGLPHPQIVLSADNGCELHGTAFSLIAHLLNVPLFHIYYPFAEDYKRYLGYLTKQVEEFIAFAQEKVPGIKYDENILGGLVEVGKEWSAFTRQIYDLKRRVPCPEHPQDAFRELHLPFSYPNPRKILEYYKAYRDELSAKVQRGFSPVKEERLRLLWTTSGPFGTKLWDVLLERGVTVPYVQYGLQARHFCVGNYPGFGDTTEYGRKLSPIEEIVRARQGNSFGTTAKQWIDQALTVCRECKIDAIINFDQIGCTPVTGYSQLLKDAAERELGIPTLNIIGREQLTTKEEEEKFVEQVDNFITYCLKRKGY